MNRLIFRLKHLLVGWVIFIWSCTSSNQLSMQDTALAFSRALVQGNEKVVYQLLLPNDANKKLYEQWAKWYSLRDENTKRALFVRSQSKFEILQTDILQPDSLVIVQVKFEIPNIPNNILKLVYYNRQWLIDWAYSESGNF